MDDRNDSPIPSPALSVQSGISPLPSPPLTPPSAPAASSPVPETVLPPSHLQHLTWEQYADFDPPPGFVYEIVDGLVVHKAMACAAHNALQSALGILMARVDTSVEVYVDSTLQVLPSSWAATSGSAGAASSSSGAASSPSPPVSPSRQSPNIRVPDVSAYFTSPRQEGETVSPTPSTTSSAVRDRTERYSNQYAKKRVTFPAGKAPYMAFEVTSESNRNMDLMDKWVHYAVAGVQLYVILDLACPKKEGKPSIIIGSLKKREGWEKSTTGHPKEGPIAPRGSGPHVLYYFKKFSGRDVVDVSYFSKLKLKADEMLSASHLRALGNRILKEHMQQKKRAEAAEKKVLVAESRAENAEKKALVVEMRAGEEVLALRKRLEAAEKKALAAEREAEKESLARKRMREKLKARGVSSPESESGTQRNRDSNSASPSSSSPVKKRQHLSRSRK